MLESLSYEDAVRSTKKQGHLVKSRLGETLEISPAALTIPPIHLPWRNGFRRELGYAEVVQYLTGTFDLGMIKRVAPNIEERLFSPAAAYGPRDNDQLKAVIDELNTFEYSRRATIALPDPGEGAESRPCTTSLQFLIRNGACSLIVSMRSWDLWFGAPYDLMLHSALLQVVSRCTGTNIGSITVLAGSMHLYERYFEADPGRRTWFFTLPSLKSYREFVGWAWSASDGWTVGPPDGVAEVIPVSVMVKS